MIPHLIIVGADKGGVGKTTVSRILLDYLKNKSVDHAAWDTQTPEGVLRRFYPDVTAVVDLADSDGQMLVLDNLGKHAVTLIDIRASLLSPMLETLAETGFLERMRQNQLRITVLHILGSTKASFDEIKTASELMLGAKHILVTNYINKSSFLGLSHEMRALGSGAITIGKLDERAAEYVDREGVGFTAFVDNPACSETLRGYVRTWRDRCYLSFDSVQLSAT
jgi:hypothetical protein